MCAPAIRKFLSPIFVALPSVVPRWMVQYSRMMLSLPISTFVFRSGENETSCGGAPITAPWPTKLPVPISDFSFNDDVRLHDRFVADRYLRSNDGKWADLDTSAELRGRIDNRCRINLCTTHLFSDFDIQIFPSHNTPASLKLK